MSQVTLQSSQDLAPSPRWPQQQQQQQQPNLSNLQQQQQQQQQHQQHTHHPYPYQQPAQQKYAQPLPIHHHPANLPASPSSPTLSSAVFPPDVAAQTAHYSPPSPSSSTSSTTRQYTFDVSSSPSATRYAPGSGSSALLQNSPNTSTPLASRSRKPPPSPLQTSTVLSSSPSVSINPTPTAVAFPPSFSGSPRSPRLPQSLQTLPSSDNHNWQAAGDARSPNGLPLIITTSPRSLKSEPVVDSADPDADRTYFDSDSSRASSPVERNQSAGPFPVSSFPPNDHRSISDSVVPSKPLAGSTISSRAAMAGSSTLSRAKDTNNMPRKSSTDSGISALSNGSAQRKDSTDSTATTHDIPSIIKAAGSPEAVIEHLLKEKQAQYTQNSQLWRLVDKQRAMILGLNKDLERALKDKEKYRKRLKDLLPDQHNKPPSVAVTIPPNGSMQKKDRQDPGRTSASRSATTAPRLAGPSTLDSPVSPTTQSPVDVSFAPYPITPPADNMSHQHTTAVGELLDPVSSMPRPQDHALDNFDHEAEDREADVARKRADASDLPINLSLPPSRSAPSRPPQVPPPQIPSTSAPGAASPDSAAMSTPALSGTPVPASSEDSVSQFPPPLAPPPRKPPPTPLALRDSRPSPTIPIDDEVFESDSDYDSLLEVKDVPETEKRGRRRTREEDDRERELLALKEAEMRSLSKKSKNGGMPLDMGFPLSPNKANAQPMLSPHGPNSLNGMLNSGGEADVVRRTLIAPPLASPGLPASPRPMGSLNSPMHSPPLSPRMAGMVAIGPGGASSLTPRPPRQPIPLPPNTPLQTPSPPAPAEPLVLASPKPLLILKSADLSEAVPSSPSLKSETSLESPGTRSARTRVFKGFVTEEYPDLLLPPNALLSVDIKVASSRMKPSRASLMSLTQLEEDPVFTLAVLSRADGGELWRVEKDSASLVKLDQRMKQCANFTARTPDRSLFSGHAPAKLDARRRALNMYLDELVNTALDTATVLELCRYLSTNTLPPNADETGSVVASPGDGVQDGKAAGVNNKTSGPGGRPLKKGYLTKRGKNFGGWKARFFVLDGPQLKYYETPGGAHLGTIKLQNAQIGKQAQHSENSNSSPARNGGGSEDLDNQYRHAFLILEPKKKDPSTTTKHVLCAESDEERDQWVESLLRWIDYRDTDDEDDVQAPSKKQASSDKQQQLQTDSAASRGPSTPASKKKLAGKKQRQQQQQNSSIDSKDLLIGVSYDKTQAGEAPQGAPMSARHDSDAGTVASQSPYTISAPRDMQVISDASSWSNRSVGSGNGSGSGGLAVPSVEEKKARKRSFFGFGMKSATPRPSGDDSLFGDGNGSGGSGGGGSSGYNGPPRQVFGAPLVEAVRYNGPVDVRVPLPAVVYRCIQYLDARGAVTEEGIFRLSGSNVVIKQLRERFNNESDVNLLAEETYHDIHAVASLLKMYLRELPTTILTRDLHMKFLAVTEIADQEEKLAALAELATRLPEANATLLKYLIAFLIKIINRADRNKMTVRNVGIVFSPTLNIPAPVFALLLQHYEAIFGIEPEEYELLQSSDSPRSSPKGVEGGNKSRPLQQQQQQQQQQKPSSSGGDGSLQRPSTAQTSESPHRQRLLEAVMVGSSGGGGGATGGSSGGAAALGIGMATRSTPSPPQQMQPTQYQPQLMQQQQQQQMAPQQAPFAFPMPGQQRMTSYDPQFYAQQQSQPSGQVSLRPAYESGFVIPPGYDVMQMGLSPAGMRNSPGYDRPIYQNSRPTGNRRESVVLPPSSMSMGSNGMNGMSNYPPGQRSRLRDEGRY